MESVRILRAGPVARCPRGDERTRQDRVLTLFRHHRPPSAGVRVF